MQINNHKRIIFFILIFSVMFFRVGDVTHAAGVCQPDSCPSGYTCVEKNKKAECSPKSSKNPIRESFKAPTTTTTFSKLMCSITTLLSETIIPPVAVLMTLVVGFLFLVSRGDPEKTRTANKVLLFTVIGVAVVLLSPAIVGLIADIFNTSGGTLASCGGSASVNIISNAIINLVNWFSWFMAITAVVTGLYSGFLFMTASGDAERLNKSWKTFVFAIIGIAVAVFAFSIISIVEIFVK